MLKLTRMLLVAVVCLGLSACGSLKDLPFQDDGDQASALTLFENAENLEQELTDYLTGTLASIHA